MSIDSLIHHPLAVGVRALRPDLLWSCRTEVPDAGDYSLQGKPHSFLPLTSPEAVHELCAVWLRRRRIGVQCAWFGLLEPERRRVWVADMVGELCGAPVLIVVYFTARKRGEPWQEMREYTARLRGVCEGVYRLPCGTALLNLYGNGRVAGEVTPVE